jgi:signal transduction histidine kinase
MKSLINLLNTLKESVQSNNSEIIQEICNFLPFGLYIKELENFTYVFVNDKFCEIFRKEKNQIIGKDTSNLIVNNNFNFNLNFKPNNLKNYTKKFSFIKILTTENIFLSVMHYFDLILDENGIEKYSIGILVLDESNENIANITLKSNLGENFKFNELIESVSLPVIVVDSRTNNVQIFNSVFENIFNQQNSNLIDQNIANTYLSKNSKFLLHYKLVLSHFLKIHEKVIEFEQENGTKEKFLCIFNYLQKYNMVLIVFLPLAKNNDEIDYLTKRANKLEEMKLIKSNFISLVSHEFRTPLTKIMLSADLLLNYSEKMSLTEKNDKLKEVKYTIYDMIKLMEAVITVSKLETDDYQIMKEKIDIASYIAMLVDNVKYQFIHKPITFESDLKIKDSILYTDLNLFGMIFTNILNNAVKFSNENDTIQIKVIWQNDIFQIEISDNGIGIPYDEIPLVFNSFYKASNNINIPGYGLGLYIAKKCMDIFGGNIKIDSKENIGTKVTIQLPMQ